MRVWIPLSLIAIVAACGTAPTQPVDGAWQAAITIPGVGRTMTLAQHGTDVSGTGTWTGEAINPPSGALTVTGTASGSQVTLTFQYDNGRTTTFTGNVLGQRLAGIERAGTVADSVVFLRQ